MSQVVSESIHGHQVMEFMISLGRAVSKLELEHLIAERFGEQARFHTCSASEMDAKQLIAFLEKKGKFTESATGVETSADRICNH
ncbi:YecH family metal-binding protein [Shewanella sp. Isolate11]|uniref:YecH family metal-binding protein n=1 Tax=Shewanella sp. Isolate11 TaxID=2908530 RepID=UPI001EFCFBD5|nr:YecH family metal-binding protein [Shewanella sp. Isolate11]MCG9696374.1 YecH family protein [Shewanella sp. Isolate11]